VILEAIAAARTAGFDLTPTGSTVLRPIGRRTWFQPSEAAVIRNEGGELPYAIYTLDGRLKARVQLKRHACSYDHKEAIGYDAS
jgi:hypothetical protein